MSWRRIKLVASIPHTTLAEIQEEREVYTHGNSVGVALARRSK